MIAKLLAMIFLAKIFYSYTTSHSLYLTTILQFICTTNNNFTSTVAAYLIIFCFKFWSNEPIFKIGTYVTKYTKLINDFKNFGVNTDLGIKMFTNQIKICVNKNFKNKIFFLESKCFLKSLL